MSLVTVGANWHNAVRWSEEGRHRWSSRWAPAGPAGSPTPVRRVPLRPDQLPTQSGRGSPGRCNRSTARPQTSHSQNSAAAAHRPGALAQEGDPLPRLPRGFSWRQIYRPPPVWSYRCGRITPPSGAARVTTRRRPIGGVSPAQAGAVANPDREVTNAARLLTKRVELQWARGKRQGVEI
jgi:hypothetical protein